MELPNRDHAYIPKEKLTDYLLSESHPVGRSKAKFFRSLGFDESNVDLLEAGLLTIAQTQSVAEEEITAHGAKYVVLGEVVGPSIGPVNVRTVWIIDVGAVAPRFVTAYPD